MSGHLLKHLSWPLLGTIKIFCLSSTDLSHVFDYDTLTADEVTRSPMQSSAVQVDSFYTASIDDLPKR